MDWLSGCLIHHKRLLLPLSPLRSAERSILFSGKSVRLSDDARSAASSHAPKKGCSLREVWRSQTCTSGSPFFCLLFFGEAKKSKCPAGTKRMVKTTPKANHKAGCLFPSHKGSLKNEMAYWWFTNISAASVCRVCSLAAHAVGTFAQSQRQPETQNKATTPHRQITFQAADNAHISV